MTTLSGARLVPRIIRVLAALVAGSGAVGLGPAHAAETDGPPPLADEPPLVTDRPGNGNAASVVPRSSLQIEASALHGWEALAGTDVHLLAFPVLLRYGLLSPIELRLGTGVVGFSLTDAAGPDTANPTDTSVGTKLQLLSNDGAVPDLSLGADVFLPSGDGPFTGDAVGLDARALSAWALPADLGLLLNAGADVPKDAAGRHVRFLHVVNLGYSPPALEGRLSVFVESFGATPLSGGRSAVQQIDWGAALLVVPLWQIDAFVQHGLTDAALDLQISLGVSTRL